jgi:hypothetical protein
MSMSHLILGAWLTCMLQMGKGMTNQRGFNGYVAIHAHHVVRQEEAAYPALDFPRLQT